MDENSESNELLLSESAKDHLRTAANWVYVISIIGLTILICGMISLAQEVDIYLHVVCEYADPVYVEFVTAYIPDEQEWESPPFRRREGKRK